MKNSFGICVCILIALLVLSTGMITTLKGSHNQDENTVDDDLLKINMDCDQSLMLKKDLSDLLLRTTRYSHLQSNQFLTTGQNEDDTIYLNTGLAVCGTTDKGFAIVGSTGEIDVDSMDVEGEMIVVKTDENGSEQWMKTYTIGDITDGLSIQQTTGNGFIIGGTSLDEPYITSALLLKLDEQGNKQWAKTFQFSGFATGTKAIQTADGGYLLTGETVNLDIPGTTSAFVLKTDSNGDQQWIKYFEVSDLNVGYSLVQTMDKEYILAGYTAVFDLNNPPFYISDCDIILFKIDEEGKTIFSSTFDIDENDICYSVDDTSDGGCVMTGVCNAFESDPHNLFVLKCDELGITDWTSIIHNCTGRSIEQTTDDGFLISGSKGGCSAGSCTPSSSLLIKTNAHGTKQWDEYYPGLEQAVCNQGCITQDDGYVLTGATLCEEYEYLGQILLLKTDEDGIMQWQKTFCKHMPDTTLSLAFDETGLVVENTGDIFAKNVEMFVEIQGGLLGNINSKTNLSMNQCDKGDQLMLEFPEVFGFGKVEITADCYAYNAPFRRVEQDGFVFLRFLKLTD